MEFSDLDDNNTLPTYLWGSDLSYETMYLKHLAQCLARKTCSINGSYYWSRAPFENGSVSLSLESSALPVCSYLHQENFWKLQPAGVVVIISYVRKQKLREVKWLVQGLTGRKSTQVSDPGLTIPFFKRIRKKDEREGGHEHSHLELLF